MNKNAIKEYAIWARKELIEQVNQRAYQYGISEKGYGDGNATVISGRVLSADEKRQRHEFVSQIEEHGYQQTIEEVAYTWFNRFVALRYMEVNEYLPTHVRVLSDAGGGFNPEILKDVLHLDLPGLDKEKVSDLLNTNKTEELYRYLLLTQCNALNEALPEMFEKLDSYTEMLLPNNILKPDSVLGRLVTDIPEEDFRDAVQIIGWMYQYYNTEPKAKVFSRPKGEKIKREDIPAATQLFTPDWIVRYMVENSLGRLWIESHPNDTLKANWKYYLDEAEQTPEIEERLRVLRSQSTVKSPEDISLIDPCMGSGHILVYAFDVLMQIYESEGYNPRDAAKLILENNVCGLDIDRRAYQLSYFSLMMKARQYNRRIFTDGVKPQVYHPVGFPDGEEYGSLVKVDMLPPKPELPKDQLTIFDDYERDLCVWNFKRLLVQKHDIVVTNPPYAGSNGLNSKIADFLKKQYPNSKSDLFSAFIEKCMALANKDGYIGMITQQAFMFLGTFEKLRTAILESQTIVNMLHFGYGTFGADFGTTAFVFRNGKNSNYIGQYCRLADTRNVDEKRIILEENLISPQRNVMYKISQFKFKCIPGNNFSYWISDDIISILMNSKQLSDIATIRVGMHTGDNEIFTREWFEVSYDKFTDSCLSHETSKKCSAKWFPYNKGGGNRRWYGYRNKVVNWQNGGSEIHKFHNLPDDYNGAPVRAKGLQFKEGITWSDTGSTGLFAARYSAQGAMFDVKGSSAFLEENYLWYVLAFLNVKIATHILNMFNPTITYQVGNISTLPFIMDKKYELDVVALAMENVELSKYDYNSDEISWDFKCHPLLRDERTVAAAFAKWERETNERFDTLKANEEELNRIFIDIYGLQDELTPEVEDKDVTVRRPDLGREIRSLISYAVGCMFGRYSLDVEGLAYAGGDWDNNKYKTFIPDKDNILPICDDEYFDDDIAGRFVDFVKTVYGANTLEENLKFIADALDGKGTPRDIIRNYFLNGFFADHCKIYQKRPIYWLFDSGKKNGFKALIYMHRYSRDLLAKLRTDYVHEQQERYRTQLSHIDSSLNTATGAERARLLKQQDKMTEQLKEITTFEENVHHLADQNIEIDLDDGVKVNYDKFAEVLAKI